MTRQANIKWANVLTVEQTADALARRIQIDRDERRAYIQEQLDAENLRNAMEPHERV